MNTPLDDIRFLADSEHRFVVLDVLSSDAASRAALRDAAGASSATIGRIVGVLEERHWLARTGHEYALTPLGAFVARKFATHHESIRTARDLEDLLSHLPLDERGVEVDRLAGGSITQPTPGNPLALASRLGEIERETAHARSLTVFFPEPCVDARYRAVVEATQTFEAVFTPNAIETAMSPSLSEEFQERVASDRMTLYFYDGDLPWSTFLNDGVACLVVRNEDQTAIGRIETDNDAVVAFATGQFERYSAQSTRLTVDGVTARYETTALET